MSELHYDNPAGHPAEALPIGNGRTGAMVFGRVAQERLQLSEFSRFAQAPYAAGDVLLDFIGLSAPVHYRRWLDLHSAMAITRMRIGLASHQREAFASAPDQVVVLRLEVGSGAMDFDLGYRHPSNTDYAPAEPAHAPGASWDRQETLNREQRPSTLSVRPDGEALLIAGLHHGRRYAVRVKAVGDGWITQGDDRVRVRGATRITLLIAIAANFDLAGGDAVRAVRAQTEAAARKPYDQLMADHVAALGPRHPPNMHQSRKDLPCSQAYSPYELPAYRS